LKRKIRFLTLLTKYGKDWGYNGQSTWYLGRTG
jgi:hypothetical protein